MRGIETMQHVRQKHAKGCVVACLSMITGIPYDEIIPDFYGDRETDGLSCSCYDVGSDTRDTLSRDGTSTTRFSTLTEPSGPASRLLMFISSP